MASLLDALISPALQLKLAEGYSAVELQKAQPLPVEQYAPLQDPYLNGQTQYGGLSNLGMQSSIGVAAAIAFVVLLLSRK